MIALSFTPGQAQAHDVPAVQQVSETLVEGGTQNEAPKSLKVSGRVVDKNGEAVIGAAVMVKGTTTGTSTDIDGKFELDVKNPETAVLEFSYLGFQTQEVKVGTRTSFMITMVDQSVSMDAVVVTALGIKRSEKALSYNAQQVKADDIIANKDVNFVNSLNGKVAGVTINASSSGVGGASKVVMRGEKSILQSSNALYVIDGVPMFAPSSAAGMEFDSRGTSEPIADMNPEDIESMTVLNGAAAAALYGSDAANGAIIITTKKGKAGTLSVTVSSNTEISTPFIMPEFQNRYGTGDLLSPTPQPTRSWGKLLNESNYRGYDPKDDYFQVGVTGTESISLTAGSEKNQTYFSAAAVDSRGIIPNNSYDRYNFTFRNTTNFLKDKISLTVGASYIKQEDRNMTNQGIYNNPLVGAYLFPRGDDWADIKMFERYNPARKIYMQYWPVGDAGMTMQNPYWINYRNLREGNKDRYMFNASLSYKILDWLTISGRLNVDNSVSDYEEKFYASTNTQLTESSNRGLYGMSRAKDRQTYGDFMVNINKTWDDWSFMANLGASIADIKADNMRVRGPIADGSENFGDEKPGLTNFFAIQNLSPSKTEKMQEGWREQTQSIFASFEVGYKGTYYLTLTGRNDWPSQLAGPHSKTKSFFYPSVGGSIVLSQLIGNMPKNLSYIKLRGSFASVGVAFERFLANPRYQWSQKLGQWTEMTNYPLSNLKPERTKSWEIGLTMRFLKHFELDATYYNAKTSNQTFDPDIPVSGWSKLYLQTGSVRNRGIELALNYHNTWGKFSWNSSYTVSSNSNRITSLSDNAVNPQTGESLNLSLLNMGGLGDARFLLKEGGSMGDLYSLVDLKRDSNNNILIDYDGSIKRETIKDPDNYVKLGSVLPDANMAWNNSFKYGNFNMGFLVTARLGGIVFSRTQAILDDFGVSEATAVARDRGYSMTPGGDFIAPQKWYAAIGGGNSVPQYYTYSATNVRLQEASIGYTIPRKALRGVCEITVSLVGRNLWMIYNKAPFDPENVASTGNFYQGIDYFMMPAMRNIGFNVRLKF